jgi:glycosyltransferase involved in cell wall biosynthesis
MSTGTELPFVSVIIPTYRRLRGLTAALKSVLANDYPADRFEIIVVDSGPDDGTVALIEDLSSRYPGCITYIRKNSEGPSASRNVGASHARGDIFAFMDSDCQAESSWIRGVVHLLAERPEVGVVQGKTLPPPGEKCGPGSRFLLVDTGNWIFETCNVIYRRAAFEKVGGFDRRFYRNLDTEPAARILGPAVGARILMSGEDADLAWRVKSAGWESAFCPEAIVYHEIRRLTPLAWIVDEGCCAWGLPMIVRTHPQIRQYLFWRYFSERAHAFLPFLFLGFALLVFHWSALLLCIPYVVSRASDSTRSWSSFIKPLRALVYLPRDIATFTVLLMSSIKHRTLAI